ncbi:hypothetical protein [Cystobacter fuscus]|uniref:hypothetical protein n=1 Tax=Cystobacter fuscus TaxID=43 RepID=UPI002B2AC771|nr:hypothetical protein F0U63_32430 [Cystobacter fuscus]
MKHSLLILATLVLSIVSGCGGTEVETGEELLAQSQSALSTCSTTCSNGNTISCQGTSCSASDGVSVTCDGNTTYCGLVPVPICSRLGNSCSNVNGQSCISGTTRNCCIGGSNTGTCICRSSKWSCPLVVDPGPLDPGPLEPWDPSPVKPRL